jgi:hypothetical protein
VNRGGSIAAGAVMLLVGVLVILRTVTKDDTGANLVDRVLNLGGGGISTAEAQSRNAEAIAAAGGDPSKVTDPAAPKGVHGPISGASFPPSSTRQRTKPHRSTQKARR